MLKLLFVLLLFSSHTYSQLQVDAKLWGLLSPTHHNIPDCQANDSVLVSVMYENIGIDPLFNIPISFQLDNGPVYTDTIPIAVTGLFHIYTFANTINIGASSSHTVLAWTSYPGDMAQSNDTTYTTFSIVPGNLLQLPIVENFESYTQCDTTPNCNLGVCPLGVAWMNVQYGIDSYDFRVNSGSTPTDSTGPDYDHTTGDTTGNYIYIESSGNCSPGGSILNSACIDLTSTINPQFSFWYHMFSSNDVTLLVEIYKRGRWYTNQIPPITGNQGNLWKQARLNLSSYNGEIINIRILAFTEGDSLSDLAIDDILVTESNYPPPFAAIGYSKAIGCTGTNIMLFGSGDTTISSWNWNISPAGYTYINGTDSISRFPEIQFNTAGLYSVQLIVSNPLGSDTAFDANVIQIFDPAPINTIQDFESGIFPPAGYFLGELDGWDWDQTTVTGINGTSTTAMISPNFINENTPTIDEINTIAYDLSNSNTALLTFDIAYARYNSLKSDTLHIDVSTDCGITFTPTGYRKGGQTLATVADQTTAFYPAQASEWRKDSIILTPWQFPEVVIRFVNKNGYGNNLFIDNILIQSAVGISETNSKTRAHAYPNPSSNQITLEIESPQPEKILLQLLDFQGRVITSESIHVSYNFTKVLDLENYAPGIYLLRTSGKYGSTTERITLVR